MSQGTFEATFSVRLDGLQIPDAEVSVLNGKLAIRKDPASPERGALEWSVSLAGVFEDEGRAQADAVTRQMYQVLLLKFAGGVELAVPPRSVSDRFTPDSSATSSVTKSIHGGFMVAPPEEPVSRADLEAAARALTQSAGSAARAAAALDMMRFALESPNKAVRFVVLYSVLALAVRSEKQKVIDAAIRQANPAVPEFPRPDKPGETETLYAKLRNDLLHSENPGRGNNPQAAITAIQAHIAAFQADVASIISRP